MASEFPARVEDIPKSEHDKRFYRVITLENGLQATLVSDPDTDKSAAAMSVGAGHLGDPEHAQGIAHFVEHMLFMGSEKYPDENEYSKFISEHGGGDNAYTMEEETRYYFNVSPDAYAKALDVFANFFVKPLFGESSVEREMKAIDSEHNKNLNSDPWRVLQIFYTHASENSPIRKFGTGCLKTLDIPTIKEDLHKFYDDHYSANVMKLCMIGRESLDELEKMATESFSGVVNRGITRERYDTPSPYDENASMKLFRVVPVRDSKELKVIWTLDDYYDYHETKPLRYLSSLIGHEGPNSLLSYLMERQWVTSLSSMEDNLIRGCTQLMISIDLTASGLEHYEEVVQSVFAYIHMLRETGVSESYWNELKTRLDLAFRFKGKESAQEYATTIVGRMQRIPAEKILAAPSIMKSLDADLIKKALDSLRVENSNVILVSKSMEEFANLTEPWYEAKYSREDYPETLVTKMRDPKTGLPESKTTLGMPPANNFLPDNINILPFDGLPKYPSKLMETEKSLVFFKQNNTFAEPRASVKVKLYCNDNDFATDPENYLASKVWLLLFEESMREVNYMADQAGLMTKIDFDSEGFEIHMHGYNDSMKNWVPEVMKRMYSFKITDDLNEAYQNCYEAQKKKVQNYPLMKPFNQALDGLKLNLLTPTIDMLTLKDHIDAITMDRLRKFSETWMKCVHHEWLIVGNFTPEEVKNIIVKSEAEMTAEPLSRQNFRQFEVVELPKGLAKSLRILINPKESNSASLLFYQSPDPSLKNVMILEVISQYLSEPFFNQLRTIEQLGYLVWAFKQEIRGHQGITFLIQSSVGNPGYLTERIQLFLEDTVKKIEEISDEEFDTIVKAVITMKSQKPLRLSSEARDYWSELTQKQYLFDRKDKEIELLKQIQKAEFISSFKSLFIEDARALFVGRCCKKHKKGEDCLTPSKPIPADVVIEDPREFVSQCTLLPDLYNSEPNRFETSEQQRML